MSDLSGKHGLILGVANKRSICWAIAQAAAKAGARLAFTYPSDRLEENVRELAGTVPDSVVARCDVTSDQEIADLAATLDREFGGLDFFVHGAGFAPPPELSNPFVQTSREGFRIVPLDVRRKSSSTEHEREPSSGFGGSQPRGNSPAGASRENNLEVTHEND